MKQFGKPSIYQSDLREAGPLVVRIKTRPTKSKREGGGEYVSLQVAGDATTYHYTVENDRCREVLAAAELGRWHLLTATGMREEGDLLLEDAPADKIPAEDPPEARSVEEAAANALILTGRVFDRYRRTYGREPTAEEITFAISCMIRSESTGVPLVRGMPDLTNGEDGGEQLDLAAEGWEEGTGETPASLAELAELTELAEECGDLLSQTRREEFDEWVSSGSVTRIDYVRMRERLREILSRREESSDSSS